MPNFIAIIFVLLLLSASTDAHACTIFPPDPEETFAGSDSVVLARPIEITPKPSELEKHYGENSYEQSVTWQVLYRWKGSFSQDDRFVTNNVIHIHDPCSGWDVIRDYQPRLVYSSGEQPFASYYSIEVAGAIQFLRSLQDRTDPIGN